MIVKSREDAPLPDDPLLRAGMLAERQMAHYLHRAFASDPTAYVLNDLRLVDHDQPEHDGRDGVAQIDHLVLHRWGGFIIESKSVTDEVAVRGDGAGGDEWTRRYHGREQGFSSPIQQARRQGEFLRRYLNARREELLGKAAVGFRTVAKLVLGTDQRSFSNMPIQVIVAISDRGKIRRVDGWREPTCPFPTYVSKADLVADKIRHELGRHRASSSLIAESQGDYGVWSMKPEELPAVAEWLKDRHTPTASPMIAPHTPPSPSSPAESAAPPWAAAPARPRTNTASAGPRCKACGGATLEALWGKYGYYWKCADCGTNTAMPTTCSACGAQGQHGRGVRIRKEGPSYYRVCESCAVEERVWTQQGQQ